MRVDFVVLGFGVGAFAVLVGLGVRDLGPMLRRLPRPGLADLPWSEVARRVAWGRTCRAAGLFVTLAGAALCLLTLLVLVTGASDDLGMVLVILAVLVAIVGFGAWAAVFRLRGVQAVAERGIEPGRASGDRRSRREGAGRTVGPPRGRAVAERGAGARPPVRSGVGGARVDASAPGEPERSRAHPASTADETTARAPGGAMDLHAGRKRSQAVAPSGSPGRAEQDA